MILERRSRKGPILTGSSLPCLRDIPTINITEGCAHGCAYCYTQGYSNYPGAGRVILFDNTPDLVRSEMSRRRRRPRRVYFSPSSDPFQPVPEVQETTYQTMAVLLEGGVEVAFLTKGAVGERFLSLFAKMPGRVFAQVGITTLDHRLWQAFEPAAASPSQRLDMMERLVRTGIATTARLDPLIPDLTDTEAGLTSLLSELQLREVRDVAASYLFLRPAFTSRLTAQMRRVGASPPSGVRWSWRGMAAGVGGARMLGTEDRRSRFGQLETLAARYGIGVHVCSCKNPDLGCTSACRIAGPTPESPQTQTLPLFAPKQP